MGNGNSVMKMSKTEILNEISNTIDNQMKNLTRVFNETINKVCSQFVLVELQNQPVNQTSAIINIMNDTQKLQRMASTIQTELVQQITIDTRIKAFLDIFNRLRKSKEGGPENMLAAVMKAISESSSNLSGTNTREQIVDIIKNKMPEGKPLASNTDITNIIKNHTDNMVRNIFDNKCGFNTKTGETRKFINNKLVSVPGTLSDFNNCVISAMNVDRMLIAITGFQASREIPSFKTVPSKPKLAVIDKDGMKDVTCEVYPEYHGCRENFTNVMNVTKNDNCDNMISILSMFAIFFLLFSIIKRKI